MKLQDIFIKESADMSELPADIIKSLQHELESLAKDPDKMWPNALAMVHEAYEIVNVERPTPAMRAAWVQYEDLLSMAVRLLNKHQPDGQWRVTTLNPSSIINTF